MSKKAPVTKDKKAKATSSSMRELAKLLRRFAEEFDAIAVQIDKQSRTSIAIAGLVGVDAFTKRLNGYLINARRALGLLSSVSESPTSYHVSNHEEEQRQ